LTQNRKEMIPAYVEVETTTTGSLIHATSLTLWTYIHVSSKPYVKYGVRSPMFIWVPCAQLYSLAKTPPTPPPLFPHLALGSYTKALLVSHGRRHLFVTPYIFHFLLSLDYEAYEASFLHFQTDYASKYFYI
jgi:hypothetical protein